MNLLKHLPFIKMSPDQLKPNLIVRGALFPEPVQVITTIPMGNSVKLIGCGLNTNQTYQSVLNAQQIALLEMNPEKEPFDGNARKFRLAIEAMRLGIAYEYDPYFSLSIARVDPLPHQLEAVYEYFLKLPRIRFLLADDPGAGKTIMAGLLIKELKARGLIKRVLIVAPANLTFQWQREMKDKFREQFSVIRSDILRANYGSNPWQEYDQVVTSVSWVSRIDDARDSLLRSHWDLVIVDEAHKMSAYNENNETLAYKLGKALSDMTDHYLLMTATPHKGDPQNFALFLQLLDKDVYGDVSSLEKAMQEKEAPFYLRRVKEALVTFPDPETGQVKSLFTKRIVKTAAFEINAHELDFYDALTRFVQDQSIRAASQNSPQARAVGFTMAMLQRRFASSLYAAKRTLERMRDRREKILEDPEGFWRDQINRRVPEGFDDLEEEEQQAIIEQLESMILSPDPAILKEEIRDLNNLIQQAGLLESKEVETKLNKLKDLLMERGIFSDAKMKLLVFTEHKDTLDYLAGDGKDGRPYGKLREWGLELTMIHGGMKIGDRDTPGSRIFAERDFKESAQVMVATEAAGEGINLQFCWLMVNYDIPWNPVRLEQRMGRIHRYGQEKDCLIFNFVATNTAEGRVLEKLFERIEQIERDLDPGRTGKIFNVLGDVFPSNLLERMLRDMYARNQTEQVILDRIIHDIDKSRFTEITNSTLEGLAKKELNLSAIIGKSAEAKERRLVPEVIEDFFIEAAKDGGLKLTNSRGRNHVFRVGRIPRNLIAIGDELEPRFGRLGKEYQDIIFDKEMLKKDASCEWVTPGHPLFEVIRTDVERDAASALGHGAIFHDLHRDKPLRLDVYSSTIRDGCNNILNRRIFVVGTDMEGNLSIHNPTIFHEIVPAESASIVPDDSTLPGKDALESFLLNTSLLPFLQDVQKERQRETKVVESHVETSLNTLLNRENLMLAELVTQKEGGSSESGLDGRIKQAENRIDELSQRLEHRRVELQQQRQCTVSDIRHHGRAWVMPHPDRNNYHLAPMRRNDEVERTAVEIATKALESDGYVVESVESQNVGYDLKARKFHPEDPNTAISIRFVEVKGRAFTGEIALTQNEYKTAERLRQDYWLYVVFHCGTDSPSLNMIRDPARLRWEPIVKVEHYRLRQEDANNPKITETDQAPYGKEPKNE
jgi:superfamily II DNA or RNA helicase